jgi:hypothetical protein
VVWPVRRLRYWAVSTSLVPKAWRTAALARSGVGEKRVGPGAIRGAELGEVLDEEPEADAVAAQEGEGLLDGLDAAELGELVEQEEHALARESRRAQHGVDGGAGEEAEPATVGAEALGWEDAVEREGLGLERGEMDGAVVEGAEDGG